MLDRITKRIAYLFETGTQTESPIEDKMLAALAETLKNQKCRIIPQYPVGDYRVDIAIISDKVRIAVECDGYAYHYDSPETVVKDKQRERFLMINGFNVIRFAGSEINKDAEACSWEVLTLLRRLAAA
ncbi:MAG: hypothetical protein H6Q72_4714 [Firmicutes bacterium]|nr:hypothetical protein [Bacillota bacterium]